MAVFFTIGQDVETRGVKFSVTRTDFRHIDPSEAVSETDVDLKGEKKLVSLYLAEITLSTQLSSQFLRK